MTPQGMIKTCLYDDGVFNLRDLLRAGASDNELLTAIQQAINHRAKDGFEAEARRKGQASICLLYTSPSPRDLSTSRMPSSA